MRRAFFTLAFVLAFSFSGWAQDWINVHSPNLKIISDGDTKSSQITLWRLEQVRTQFGLLMNRKKVNRNRPMFIFGLRNLDELNNLAGGRATFAGGLAVSAQHRNYLFLDLSAADFTGVTRAYTLLLLNANYPTTQPWFDEGVAQTLAGLSANEKTASLGPTPEVARTLQGGSLVPVSDLIGGNVKQSPEFRATAWLLFRWLQEGNQLEASAQYFKQVMLQHVAPEQAFTQTFSISPKDLDGALQKFRATALAPRRIDVPVALDRQTFASNKVSDIDAQAFRAEFRLEDANQRPQAISELKQLLATNHDDVEVNRALGMAYMREGDLKTSADFIRRAIELDDSSGEMHYLLAIYYNQGSNGPIQVDSAAPTILLQTEKAVALDPELSDAYALMAAAQVSMQRADKAAKSMQYALALRPRDEGLLLEFAAVQIANSRFDDAKGLLNFLKTSDNKEIAQRATAMLGHANKERQSEAKWAREGYTDPTAEKWKAPASVESKPGSVPVDESAAESKPDNRKVEYLKGTLLNVQCADKAATLKVSSGKKTWTFNVPDRSKALLIGADSFECGWHDVPVSVNYRASGASTGDIISLEVD